MTDLRPLSFDVAALTHVGLRRHANQDCVAVDGEILGDCTVPRSSSRPLAPCRFCLVADGMGGHPAGEVASRMVVEALAAGLAKGRPDREAMVALLRDANRVLFDEMARVPERSGMGTTVAGIVADAQGLTAFNVGDRRIYRIDAGRVEQISRDHCEQPSFAWMLLGLAPARLLSQCLGGFPDDAELDPHVLELPARPGSAFLLCSDGLTDMVSDRAIGALLQPDLGASVQNLFDAAMAAGGIDNVSIVLARLESEGSAAE